MPLNFEVTTIESRLAGWGMSVIFDDLQGGVGGRSLLSYYGDVRRWHVVGNECLLSSVARGQEFVFDTQGQDVPAQWILSLLEARSSSE